MNILILIIVAVVGAALGAYFTSRKSVEDLVSRQREEKRGKDKN